MVGPWSPVAWCADISDDRFVGLWSSNGEIAACMSQGRMRRLSCVASNHSRAAPGRSRLAAMPAYRMGSKPGVQGQPLCRWLHAQSLLLGRRCRMLNSAMVTSSHDACICDLRGDEWWSGDSPDRHLCAHSVGAGFRAGSETRPRTCHARSNAPATKNAFAKRTLAAHGGRMPNSGRARHAMVRLSGPRILRAALRRP